MAETRRRGADLENDILDAGWDLLLEVGYPGFTVEAVADRAHTGKAAIYRRWRDREALVLAVLSRNYLGPAPDLPDTGTLRGDALEVLRNFNARLTRGATAVFSAVLGAWYGDGHTSPAELRSRLLGDRGKAMARVLERAVERGDLPAMPPDRVTTLPTDLLRHEAIMTIDAVPDTTVVDIVDNVFLPLLRSTTADGGDGGRTV
jgi:AcrR family transcriptional regulator